MKIQHSSLIKVHSWLLIFFVALIGFTISCGDNTQNSISSKSDYEETSIALKLTASLASQLSSVEVVVTGIDMTPIRQDLELTGEVASGILQVPVGSDRLFTLNGYDETGELIYRGQGWSDVRKGEETIVELAMFPVDATGHSEWLDGTIQGLTYVTFFSSGRNWDSDAEDDGIKVSISYYTSDDEWISWEDATVGVVYRVFIASEYGSPAQKYDEPLIEYAGYLSSNDDFIRVPFEEFGTYSLDDTYNTVSGDVAIPAIEELTITMSNGARYNAREGGGIIVGD